METKEITGVETAPFRLFIDLSYNWVPVPKEWGDCSFRMRPMKNSERGLYRHSMKSVIKARDTKGAIDAVSKATGYDFSSLKELEVTSIEIRRFAELQERSNGEGEPLSEEQELERVEFIDRLDSATEGTKKWGEVEKAQKIDVSVEVAHDSVSKEILLSCIESVEISGDKTEFNEELYETLDSKVLTPWLINTMVGNSTLREAEKTALS